MDIRTEELASERRRVATIDARGRNIVLDVSNGRLEVWARHFAETEPELLDFLDGIGPDDVYFDIGASIGHFSIYAALVAGQTVAFEPEAWNFATASFNQYLNRAALLRPFHLLNIALSDKLRLGALEMMLYGAGEHTKSLVSPGAMPGRQDEAGSRPASHRQTVIEMPLDYALRSFALPHPTQMKIDVDGAERQVLLGARDTLAGPGLRRIFIELEAGETGEGCRQILQAAGFALSAEHRVRRLRGGFYDGLTNCVFERP